MFEDHLTTSNISGCLENIPSEEQLKNPVPIVKNHTALDHRMALEDVSKIPGKRQCIFWQASLKGK